jgi:hypothetical protein
MGVRVDRIEGFSHLLGLTRPAESSLLGYNAVLATFEELWDIGGKRWQIYHLLKASAPQALIWW